MLTRCLKSLHKGGVREQAHCVSNPTMEHTPRGCPHRAMFLVMRKYAVFQERAEEEILLTKLDEVMKSNEKGLSFGCVC